MNTDEYEAMVDQWRVRWFGDPWPSEDRRAPICEDDRYRIVPPEDATCWLCDHSVAGCSGESMPNFGDGRWMYAHKECMLRNVLGCSSAYMGGGHDHDGDYYEDAKKLWELYAHGRFGAH